jgi:peptidoglycan/LPS O-acetylase OafA/YrhL
LILLLGKPLGAAALLNRPMAIIGKLSYSIYLNHVPILFFLIYPVRESLGQAQYLDSAWVYVIPLAALLASTLLAYVTYRLIELPFLNIKHRLPVLAAKQ